MPDAPASKSYLLRMELLYTHQPIWREVWVPSDLTLDVLQDVLFEATEFELQQLANLPQVDEVWELGAVYMNGPVGTPSGPVVPICSIALPFGVPLDGPPQPYLGATLEVTASEAIWRDFAQKALERGCRPAQVDVLTSVAVAALKPLETLCQTRIVQQASFQQLHALLGMLSGF